jgi:hypothetical protein
VATKKAGNLASRRQVSLGNAEPAVATGVVIITFHRGHEEMLTRGSFLLYTPYVGNYKQYITKNLPLPKGDYVR